MLGRRIYRCGQALALTFIAIAAYMTHPAAIIFAVFFAVAIGLIEAHNDQAFRHAYALANHQRARSENAYALLGRLHQVEKDDNEHLRGRIAKLEAKLDQAN